MLEANVLDLRLSPFSNGSLDFADTPNADYSAIRNQQSLAHIGWHATQRTLQGQPERQTRHDAGRVLFPDFRAIGPLAALQLLKFNAQMVMGAFGVQSTPGGEMVVVCASQLANTTTALDVSRTITAIAWQADKVEEKLVGGDQN